ncbi:MAG: substrate-binding domain-containing protein [Clostridiaceae bacterium]|jgi:ABC-type sugar transport system substrate-binding protein|nr:substrate-binding domain-containing protein [Clostridiaceae bacterium]
MKKILALLLVFVLASGLAACGSAPAAPAPSSSAPAPSKDAPSAPATPADSGLIKVGIVNNPPSESGYRAANVADFEKVFNEANGYKASTFYSLKNDEQLNAAAQFITDGVDYLLISAAATDGWTNVLENAKQAGVKVFLFDRMMNVDESLFEAAVVSDMAEEGRMAVQWLIDQKLPEYNVVHIQGAMGSDAQIGRTGALDAEFEKGTMKRVIQQTATWDEATAKQIVESVINSGEKFNVIYAENDGMAKGAVAALDEAGITHGVDKEVVIMGFDCNKWALRELLAGNWNYDGQCSPFQASVIDSMIKDVEAGKTLPEKIVINEEKFFDARTITQADIDTYGLGD